MIAPAAVEGLAELIIIEQRNDITCCRIGEQIDQVDRYNRILHIVGELQPFVGTQWLPLVTPLPVPEGIRSLKSVEDLPCNLQELNLSPDMVPPDLALSAAEKDKIDLCLLQNDTRQ